MLPHKIFEEDKFFEKCKELRGRFNASAADTLFPKDEAKTIPMDGLALFVSNTWEKIRTQKELNLPDQRVMVANLRCGELKEEAMALVLPKINELKKESEQKMIEGFSERCALVLKEALTHFDQYGH